MNARMPYAWTNAQRALRSPCKLKAALAVLLLLAGAPDVTQAAMDVPKHLISPVTPKIEDPDSLVHKYLQAVDRGELEIFGQKVDRSSLVPIRIEYVYELSSRTTQVKVYSNLKAPLPVPGRGDCQVMAVSTVMEDGHITEIESHVWVK